MSSSDEPEQPKFHPVHVKVFYRTNASHRLEEFGQDPLPAHIDLNVSMTCTVEELSHLIAGHSENILPSPSVGTRLVFRSIMRSPYSLPPRAPPNAKPKFFEHTLGSYVIGRGHPGIDLPAEDESDPASTIQKLRWLPGDYIACTILPPSDRDLSIAPARSGTPSTRRGADNHPVKGIPVGDRARGEGRDDLDEDSRPQRRSNNRLSKGTYRKEPSLRTRDHDRRDN
ncbi:Sin3 associated polypeptide p18-domain-containing protein [Apiosordaria backusii]|uniref:Sin3 associated polypeptide p18-domain-containing protein n=1 Tax=Apiosordaria backusii TaxID=314023 RepID=A0AA40BMK0_9PEZI|nr:Sin3 associated polypeptide p18-domain-containing protein [Apiosordaria backusii]